MKNTGAEIIVATASRLSQVRGVLWIERLGMLSEFARAGSVPLEVWIGTAQTVEDASGKASS